MTATKEKAGAKKEAMSLLRKMPDKATLAEIIDELRLLQALEESEADSKAGRVHSLAEVIEM